ncbi:unnamed protein product [Calypogeia fissa]
MGDGERESSSEKWVVGSEWESCFLRIFDSILGKRTQRERSPSPLPTPSATPTEEVSLRKLREVYARAVKRKVGPQQYVDHSSSESELDRNPQLRHGGGDRSLFTGSCCSPLELGPALLRKRSTFLNSGYVDISMRNHLQSVSAILMFFSEKQQSQREGFDDLRSEEVEQ